jgi:hypothetical protein
MMFVATLSIVSSSLLHFHPSLVVELAHLGLQTRARRSVLLAWHILALNFITTSIWSESMFALLRVITSMTSDTLSSVDQTVIDLVEGVSIWGVPGLEVDSFLQNFVLLIAICLLPVA